jgi:hypothetical protein
MVVGGVAWFLEALSESQPADASDAIFWAFVSFPVTVHGGGQWPLPGFTVGLWAPAYLAGLLATGLSILKKKTDFEHGGPRRDRHIDEPGIVDT